MGDEGGGHAAGNSEDSKGDYAQKTADRCEHSEKVHLFSHQCYPLPVEQGTGVGFGSHDGGWRGLDGLAIGKMGDAADGEDLFRDDTRGLHWAVGRVRNRAL